MIEALRPEADISNTLLRGIAVNYLADSLSKSETTKQLVGLKDNNDESLLYKMCIYGCETIVGLLIVIGADINAAKNTGNTPLHVACLNGKKEIVKLLLANGANHNLENRDGKTAAHLAAEIALDDEEHEKQLYIDILQIISDHIEKANADHELRESDEISLEDLSVGLHQPPPTRTLVQVLASKVVLRDSNPKEEEFFEKLSVDKIKKLSEKDLITEIKEAYLLVADRKALEKVANNITPADSKIDGFECVLSEAVKHLKVRAEKSRKTWLGLISEVI